MVVLTAHTKIQGHEEMGCQASYAWQELTIHRVGSFWEGGGVFLSA